MNHFRLVIFTATLLFISSFVHAQDEPSSNLASQFVDLLRQEKFSEAVGFFDTILIEALPVDQLSAAWSDLVSQAGAYKRQIKQSQQIRFPFLVMMVTCEFENKMIDIKVVFDQKNKITGLWFLTSSYEVRGPSVYQPPAYVNRELFTEEDVSIGQGRRALAGTLTLPKSPHPFPAVILIHDRGPYDRDESIGLNKPFCDLAWGLATRNIAVLRYEKRTEIYGENSSEPTQSFTVRQEVTDDVLLAISLLSQHQKIDPKSIFILGHGFGGMLVPRIVKESPGLAGAIILAGHITSLEDVFFRVQNTPSSLGDEIVEADKSQLAALRKQVNLVQDPRLEKKHPTDKLLLGLPLKYWLDIRQYHPGIVAQSLTQPMLILQGGRDYEVTLDDFRSWKKYLAERKNIRYMLYLKLNHLFMEKKGESKSSPEDYLISGHIDQRVIDDIIDWVLKEN